MNSSQKDALKKQFDAFLHRRKDDGKVVDELANNLRSRGWTVFAFGGTPRGVYDSGKNYTPRDLDLVFDDDHFDSFASAYDRHIARKNSFGGLKLKISNIVIDAWPLSATWAFRNGYVRNPSFENLPSTTFLNVDGIIVEFAPQTVRERQVFECGFFEGWNSKTLDVNLQRNPFPSVCVARTLAISKNFGFFISKHLALYLWDMLGKITLSSIERAQLKHYGHVKFDLRVLRDIRQKIEYYLESDHTTPLALFHTRLVQSELFESLTKSPCWNCSDLPMEIKEFISSAKENEDESFINSLYYSGFEALEGLRLGFQNKKRVKKSNTKNRQARG